MANLRVISSAIAATLLSGCAVFSPKDLVEPSQVTLEQALTSVGEGLYKMKQAQQDMKTGLIAESVQVTFKLAASAKDSGKLTIDLSKTVDVAPVKKETSLGGEQSSSSEATRSNEIAIKFVNLLTIPKDTLAYSRSPEDLAKIVLLPALGGWTVFAHGMTQKEILHVINTK